MADYTLSNLVALGLSTDRAEFIHAAINGAKDQKPTPEDAEMLLSIILQLIEAREGERELQRSILNKLRSAEQAARGFARTMNDALDVAEGRAMVMHTEDE